MQLNLDENIADIITASRLLREKLLADPYRPGYHFAVPGDIGIPGDSNGCFYANGRYHLMYLYACRADSFRWGHMSSTDLIHWRHHPDALIPDAGRMPGGNAADSGIFSGGAFADSDGTVWLSYWALPREGFGGLRLAFSNDAAHHYEKWEKLPDYACPSNEFGVTVLENGELAGSADPSNIWKHGDFYYMQAGNLLVLNKFRDSPEAKHYHGDWVDLYRSRDLRKWEYVHRFYDRAELQTPDTFMPPQDGEDDMCPSFLPLYTREGGETGKYLQLFISHNRGCRYYIGRYDTDAQLFHPEVHGRMTWVDNGYFAPEALLTPDRRQIAWVWLIHDYDESHELSVGWSGVFGLPRHLWYDENRRVLGLAPADEVRSLRYNAHDSVAENDSYETELVFDYNDADGAGIAVRCGEHERSVIRYDAANKVLVFDTTASGSTGRRCIERAPLALDEGEELRLDVFVDKSVVEVYANDRQAIVRRIYPLADSLGTQIMGNPKTIRSWDIMPCNMF